MFSAHIQSRGQQILFDEWRGTFGRPDSKNSRGGWNRSNSWNRSKRSSNCKCAGGKDGFSDGKLHFQLVYQIKHDKYEVAVGMVSWLLCHGCGAVLSFCCGVIMPVVVSWCRGCSVVVLCCRVVWLWLWLWCCGARVLWCFWKLQWERWGGGRVQHCQVDFWKNNIK